VVEAADIYILLRDEYSRRREILRREIAKLPPCPPYIHLRRGAGAYICGEESSLFESIEGKRGLSRATSRHIRSRSGCFGQPTLINNVETLFWVRDLLERGRHGGRALAATSGPDCGPISVSGRVKDPESSSLRRDTVRELIEEHLRRHG
jgi:formate dehydrogenase